MSDFEHWVYAALCAWADRNGGARVAKTGNLIRVERISTGEVLGCVTVESGTIPVIRKSEWDEMEPVNPPLTPETDA